jgi:hypothetical protein
MKVRSFPETRDEPRKRILAIPFILIFGGFGLTFVHETLRFIGTVVALAGVLSVFLVGMVFADLWAASRRTKDIIKAREARGVEDTDEPFVEDPFIDTVGEDE